MLTTKDILGLTTVGLTIVLGCRLDIIFVFLLWLCMGIGYVLTLQGRDVLVRKD